MAETPAVLAQKIGGIKVQWLILIAVAAGVGGVVWRRYKGTPDQIDSAAPAPAVYDPEATGDTGDGVFSTAAGNNLGGGFAYSGNGAGTSTYSTVGTNAQWATVAANGLIGRGTYAPLDIQNALSNYITGKPLTDAQQAIVNAAISGYGSPPENVIPSTAVASPHTPTSTPTWRKHRDSGRIYAIWGPENVYAEVTKMQWASAGSPKLADSTTAQITGNKTRTQIAYPGVAT